MILELVISLLLLISKSTHYWLLCENLHDYSFASWQMLSVVSKGHWRYTGERFSSSQAPAVPASLASSSSREQLKHPAPAMHSNPYRPHHSLVSRFPAWCHQQSTSPTEWLSLAYPQVPYSTYL